MPLKNFDTHNSLMCGGAIYCCKHMRGQLSVCLQGCWYGPYREVLHVTNALPSWCR